MRSVPAFVLALLGSIGSLFGALFFGVIFGFLGLIFGALGGLELASLYGFLIALLWIVVLAAFTGSFMMISDKTLKMGSIICIVAGFFGLFNLFLVIGGILGLVAANKIETTTQTTTTTSQVKTVKQSVVKQNAKEEKKVASVSSNSGALQEDSKTWAFLGVFLTWVGYLIVANSDHKTDSYAMYYAKQGLVLGIAYVISYVFGFFTGFIPYVGWMVSSAVSLGIFVLYVMAIINAFSGELKPLPLLGGFIK